MATRWHQINTAGIREGSSVLIVRVKRRSAFKGDSRGAGRGRLVTHVRTDSDNCLFTNDTVVMCQFLFFSKKKKVDTFLNLTLRFVYFEHHKIKGLRILTIDLIT